MQRMSVSPEVGLLLHRFQVELLAVEEGVRGLGHFDRSADLLLEGLLGKKLEVARLGPRLFRTVLELGLLRSAHVASLAVRTWAVGIFG